MKRAKSLVAILTAAALMFGTASFAFADELSQTQDQEETAAPEAAEAPAEVAEEYAPLNCTEKTYFNDKSAELGVYPVIDGMDELNEKIKDTIWRNYNMYASDTESAFDNNTFKASYDVEENGQYSKIIQTLAYNKKTTDTEPVKDTFTYYVNKEDYSEMTEADYEAAVAAATAVPEKEAEAPAVAEEVAPEEEPEMLPLRHNTNLLGLQLEWNGEEKSISVIKGEDVLVVIKVDVNAYGVDEAEKVITLESAPVLSEEGVTFVPASFFTKILGAELTKDAEGKTIVKAVAVEAAPEAEETDAADAAEEEAPATVEE